MAARPRGGRPVGAGGAGGDDRRRHAPVRAGAGGRRGRAEAGGRRGGIGRRRRGAGRRRRRSGEGERREGEEDRGGTREAPPKSPLEKSAAEAGDTEAVLSHGEPSFPAKRSRGSGLRAGLLTHGTDAPSLRPATQASRRSPLPPGDRREWAPSRRSGAARVGHSDHSGVGRPGFAPGSLFVRSAGRPDGRKPEAVCWRRGGYPTRRPAPAGLPSDCAPREEGRPAASRPGRAPLPTASRREGASRRPRADSTKTPGVTSGVPPGATRPLPRRSVSIGSVRIGSLASDRSASARSLSARSPIGSLSGRSAPARPHRLDPHQLTIGSIRTSPPLSARSPIGSLSGRSAPAPSLSGRSVSAHYRVDPNPPAPIGSIRSGSLSGRSAPARS